MMTVRSISGRPVRGSVSLRKFVEHARHFVAALAAAQIDDDVGVAAFRERFEQHRLARAEAAGDRGLASARHRKHAVEDALAGDERLASTAGAPRPAAARGPASGASSRARVRGRSRRAACARTASSAYSPRSTSETTSPSASGGARHFCAMPLAAVSSPRIAPPRTVGAASDARRERERSRPRLAHAGLHEKRIGAGERPQQSVEDVAEQPWTERNRERGAIALDDRARPEARRVLVDLRDDFVAVDAHDFAQQRVVADADRFAHGERTRGRCAQHGTGDPANRRAAHASPSSARSSRAPISARSASNPASVPSITLPPAETRSPARAASSTTNVGGPPNVAVSVCASARRSSSGQPGAWAMRHASRGNDLARFGNHACDPGLAAFGRRATDRKVPRAVPASRPRAVLRRAAARAGADASSGAPAPQPRAFRIAAAPRRRRCASGARASACAAATVAAARARASPSDRVAAALAIRLDEIEQRLHARLERHGASSSPSCPRSRVARSGIGDLLPQIRDDQRERRKRRLGDSEIAARKFWPRRRRRSAPASRSRVPPRAPRFRRRRAGTMTRAPASRNPAALTSSPM